jgi:hypothetical protein
VYYPLIETMIRGKESKDDLVISGGLSTVECGRYVYRSIIGFPASSDDIVTMKTVKAE